MVHISLTHTQSTAARGGDAAVTLPPLARAAARPRAHARDRSLGDRGAGHPRRWSSWSAPGAGLADARRARRARRARSRSSAARATTAATGYVAARLLREAGRDVRVLAVAPRERAERRRARQRRARRRRRAVRRRRAWTAARSSSTRCWAPASRARRTARSPSAIAALNAAGAAGRGRRRPQRRRRRDRRGRGRGGPRAATATFAAAKPGLWINPGKSHAGERARRRHRDPGRRAGREPDVGLIDDAALLALLPARARRVDEVHQRARARRRRLARPHRRAVAGRRGRAARRRGLRHRLRARLAGADLRAPAARGDDARRSPTTTAPTPPPAPRRCSSCAERGGALVVGPGLGRSDGAVAFARALVARAEVPLVLDADGLNALAGDLERAGRPRGRRRS